MADLSAITACGECCTECPKKLDGRCPGCIEADGRVPEWAESGRCRVHACAREHRVQFCGLCAEFPCEKLPALIPWNPDIIRQMGKLRNQYGAIRLETDRLILRDYTANDFEAYYRLKSDARTMYYLQDIQAHSPEEAKEEFAGVLSDQAASSRRFYFLHMELKDTHEQVGSIGYTVTDSTPVGKLVHLGYFTFPKHWGNGYVSEALKRLLEFAFTENNVYRVTTGCLAENRGSERVMQKNGMIREAEHLDYEWHDGKMKTRLEYRLLRYEWEDRNRIPK